MNICFLATAWGPHEGGINAFNADLATAIAEFTPDQAKVFSVTLKPDAAQLVSADCISVNLLPLQKSLNNGSYDTSWIHDIQELISERYENEKIDCWVGHDTISGWAAVAAKERFGGIAALVHHMSYERYQAIKHDDPISVDEKIRDQTRLFCQDSMLFAVGPLLADSAKEMSGRNSIELIPGLAPIEKNISSNERISAITIGRLDQANDRIKQGKLAVASFSKSVSNLREAGDLPKCLNEPSLYVLGVAADEISSITEMAEAELGGAINILPLPFDPNRSALFERMSRSNLAMMLSRHEGFGLTAWEAIAAEIPLIVTKNSGVFRLLERELGAAATGLVTPIEILGKRTSKDDDQENYSPIDQSRTAQAIAAVAKNLVDRKRDASRLKRTLVDELGYSWKSTAEQFVGEVKKAISEENKREYLPALSRQLKKGTKHMKLSGPEVYFKRCAVLVEGSKTVWKTLVGPTFLEPDWLLERALQRGFPVFQTVALRKRILDQDLDSCELILRNDLFRYGANLAEMVDDEEEWAIVLSEMEADLDRIFLERLETQPLLRCVDVGYSHLPTIVDGAVVFAARPSPEKKVDSGWSVAGEDFVEAERDRWRILFDGISQDQSVAIDALRLFLRQLSPKFRTLH